MGSTEAEPGPWDVGPPRALLLTGTVGVGKSTVAKAVSDLLVQRRVPNAFVDVDALRVAWPSPPDDRFTMRLALRNLASVTPNYVQAGMTRLILAGVIETRSDRSAYESALGVPLTVCLLLGDPGVVRERLVRRHGDDVAGLQWHIDRAPVLAAILDGATVSEFSVDTTTRTPHEIAVEVLRVADWRREPPPLRSSRSGR